MLPFPMPSASSPSLASTGLVFALGALLVMALAAAIRAALTAALEPRGHRLDPWRRVWFHPERELAGVPEALLIVAFVARFVRAYELPPWALPLLAGLWALHLPTDFWNWARSRRQPRSTRWLHERGFLLLDLGPLWLRAAVVLFSAGVYFFFSPVGSALDTMMAYLLAGLQGWFS